MPRSKKTHLSRSAIPDDKAKHHLAHLEDCLELAHLEVQRTRLGAEFIISQLNLNIREATLLAFFLGFCSLPDQMVIPAHVAALMRLATRSWGKPFAVNIKTLQNLIELYLHHPHFQDPEARTKVRNKLLKEDENYRRALKQAEEHYSLLMVMCIAVAILPLMLMMPMLDQDPAFLREFMPVYIGGLAGLFILPIVVNKGFHRQYGAAFVTNTIVEQRLSETYETLTAFIENLFQDLPYKLFDRSHTGKSRYERIACSFFKPVTVHVNPAFENYSPSIVTRALSHVFNMAGLAAYPHGKGKSQITIFGIADQEAYDKSMADPDKFKALLTRTIDLLKATKEHRTEIEELVKVLAEKTAVLWGWDKIAQENGEVVLTLFSYSALDDTNKVFVEELAAKNKALFDLHIDNNVYQLHFKEANTIQTLFSKPAKPAHINKAQTEIIPSLCFVSENVPPLQPRRPIHTEKPSKAGEKEESKAAVSDPIENQPKKPLFLTENTASSDNTAEGISCYYRNTRIQLFFPAAELNAMRRKLDSQVADEVEKVIETGEWIPDGSLGKSGKKSSFFEGRLMVRLKRLGKIAGSQRPCFISEIPTDSMPEGGRVTMQYRGLSHK